MRIVFYFAICFLATVHLARALPAPEEIRKRPTDERIREQGYPAEVHQLETTDHYVLTFYRIPYSPNLENQNSQKPAILLQHGLLGCSDAWLALGHENALAFMLSDAGYDVWLGNARGNRYSRHNTVYRPKHPFFWRFSWHEIAIYDITAMIDYILAETGEKAVHYVGHSQGTTVYFALLSKLPEYQAKIKTGHMLAPVAFMSNMKTLMARYTRRLIGRPNKLTRILDTQEILPDSQWEEDLKALVCNPHPVVTYLCDNFWGIWEGATKSSTTNRTALAIFDETHPAGASSTQVLHYMQEFESQRFREFDHGEKTNLKVYGQPEPPDYNVDRIQTETHFYYSDADLLADVEDVEYLATRLGRPPTMVHVPNPYFDHGDFTVSNLAREFINDPILAACNAYEKANEVQRL